MAASNEFEKINTQNEEKENENEPKKKEKKVISFSFVSQTVIDKRLAKEEKLKAEKEKEISKGRINSIIFIKLIFLTNFS